MNWELIFKIVNTGVLPFWLLLVFGPRGMMWVRGIFLFGTGLLAIMYAVLIIGLMGGYFDSGLIIAGDVTAGDVTAGNKPGSPDFTSLAGIMALFDSRGGATIGWIHYLAFDLFVGIWIARNADRHAIRRIWQVPVLGLTLMFGPIGLLSYLALRAFLGRKLENGFTPR